MLLGRKAESESFPPRVPAGDGAGQPTDLFNRPTDVADGAGNARIAKFDKDEEFIKSWGKRRAEQRLRRRWRQQAHPGV